MRLTYQLVAFLSFFFHFAYFQEDIFNISNNQIENIAKKKIEE